MLFSVMSAPSPCCSVLNNLSRHHASVLLVCHTIAMLFMRVNSHSSFLRCSVKKSGESLSSAAGVTLISLPHRWARDHCTLPLPASFGLPSKVSIRRRQTTQDNHGTSTLLAVALCVVGYCKNCRREATIARLLRIVKTWNLNKKRRNLSAC